MSKVIKAVECFNHGYSCSQAIFSTYCEQLGIDEKSALKISCGFGGGMGRLGETCGAVTGAIMLIGLKYGKVLQEDKESKEKTYELVQKFAKTFKERNEFIDCRDLLGVDLINGDKDIVKERVNSTCSRMVKDAAEIIEELLELK